MIVCTRSNERLSALLAWQARGFDQAFSSLCSLVHRCIDNHHDACCPAWRLCHAGALNAWTAACARPSDSTKATKTLAGTHYTVCMLQCEADQSHKVIVSPSLSINTSCKRAATLALHGDAPSQRLSVAVAMPSSGSPQDMHWCCWQRCSSSQELAESCHCSSDDMQLRYTGHTATCPPGTITWPAPAAPQAALPNNALEGPRSQLRRFSRPSTLRQTAVRFCTCRPDDE